jgi:hypothetical protein
MIRDRARGAYIRGTLHIILFENKPSGPCLLLRKGELIFGRIRYTCITCTVYPRSDAAATNFFAWLKLAGTIRGRRLLEGGDKNVHRSITAYMDTKNVYSKFIVPSCLSLAAFVTSF